MTSLRSVSLTRRNGNLRARAGESSRRRALAAAVRGLPGTGALPLSTVMQARGVVGRGLLRFVQRDADIDELRARNPWQASMLPCRRLAPPSGRTRSSDPVRAGECIRVQTITRLGGGARVLAVETDHADGRGRVIAFAARQ